MTVEIINDRGLWDTFIEESPYGLLFHKWDFLKTIEQYSGYRLLTYGVYKGNELIAAFPLYYGKKKEVKLLYSPGALFGAYYIPYLGFAMSPAYDTLKQRRKESYINLVADEMNEEVKRISPNYVSISTVPGLEDVRPFIWNGYDVKVNHTYVIDLHRPIEEVWTSLEKSCKKDIRSISKYSLELKRSHDVDTFKGIMKNRLDIEGTTFFHEVDPQYLKDLMARFPDNIKMYFLYNGDDIVGVKVDCYYKDRAIAWMGDAAMKVGIDSNKYLFWESVKIAKEGGCKIYENCGADEKRLNMFKAKFNPSLDSYYTLRKKDIIGKVAEWGYGFLSKQQYLSPLKY